MDVQFLDERIAALIEARDNCQCQSREGHYLRTISNALISTYQMLKQQISESATDGFFNEQDRCTCQNGPQS